MRVRPGLLVECERRRQLPVRLNLRLQIGDLLLGAGNGIGTGDEAARRRVLVGNGNECARELRGVAGLPPVLRFPILDQRPSALVIVGDRRLGVGRRLLGEELRAKESWIDDGGIDAEGRHLGL